LPPVPVWEAARRLYIGLGEGLKNLLPCLAGG
jgi:hypothetical protein